MSQNMTGNTVKTGSVKRNSREMTHYDCVTQITCRFLQVCTRKIILIVRAAQWHLALCEENSASVIIIMWTTHAGFLDGGHRTANLLFGCAAFQKKALVHRKKKKLVYGLPIKYFWSGLCVRCVETSRFPKHGWMAQLGDEIKDFKEVFGFFFW